MGFTSGIRQTPVTGNSTKRKRIAHVLCGFGHGGSERLCLSVVQSRPDVDALVVGLDASDRGIQPAFEALEGVRVYGGPGRRHDKVLPWLTAFFRKEKPDGVIVYAFGVVHLLVALAARAAGMKGGVVVSAGNPPPLGRDRWKWKSVVVGSRALRVPIQSASEMIQRELLALGWGLPRGSSAIHNGCNVEEVARRAGSARRRQSADRPFVIGMVARLDAIKNHELLLRSLAQLPSEANLPAWELWLVGQGKKRAGLESLAAERGIGAAVKFLGARDDVPELLGQCDLFAFCTTREEGFGIAMIEAMAAGVPVVASDVPACREVLRDGNDGVLVEASEAAWARALTRLMTDAELRATLGDRGARVAAERFSFARCGDSYFSALGIPKLVRDHASN